MKTCPTKLSLCKKKKKNLIANIYITGENNLFDQSKINLSSLFLGTLIIFKLFLHHNSSSSDSLL